MFVSAWITDTLGLHPGFGAFLAGAVLPRHALTQRIKAAIEPLTLSLLLPVFFVYSGLNTSVDLMNTPLRWAIFGLIVLAASAGKGITCGLVARYWLPRAEAAAMGVLMNTRGLMELITANVGLERGLITPLLFAILILMALVTTMLTPPLLHRFYLSGRPGRNGAR
jgi:Kef-type K+ transport system membrane component KefB